MRNYSQLQAGRERASERRHRGLHTGKSAAGWNRKDSDTNPLTALETLLASRRARFEEAFDAFKDSCLAITQPNPLMTADDWRYLGETF